MPSISVASRGLPKHQALCFFNTEDQTDECTQRPHATNAYGPERIVHAHHGNAWKQYKAVRRLNYQPYFPVPKPEQILDGSPQMLRHIVTVLTLLL